MKWININTDTLRSERYLNSEPVERATWLNLLAWCVSQENSGIIEDCKNWKCRKWQQLCGITKSELDSCENLIQWSGDNLEVMFYPKDKEDEIKAKREAGRKGGIAKSLNSNKSSLAQPVAELVAEPLAQLEGVLLAESVAVPVAEPVAKSNSASTERKVKERKVSTKKSTKESRPTLEEIKNYISEKKLSVNPSQFFDYFEAGDWTDSKGNKVRNWKQKILTWEKFNVGKENTNQPLPQRSLPEL